MGWVGLVLVGQLVQSVFYPEKTKRNRSPPTQLRTAKQTYTWLREASRLVKRLEAKHTKSRHSMSNNSNTTNNKP